jgi:hypothetical protein
VSTGVTASTIAKAALGGQKAPSGMATVTNVLQNMRTGQSFYVHLPPGVQVTVLG